MKAINRPVNLIFDATNILYRTYFASVKTDADTAAGMAMHTALQTLMKYYTKYKPTNVVMAFDRSNWRKKYTESDKCISKMIYKGRRRANMTPGELARFEAFTEHITEFEQMLRSHTSILVLANHLLEADDCISGYVQVNNEDTNIVVTADSDMWQLISYGPDTTVISPITGAPADLTKWDNDPNYYLFMKIIRGDLQTDNIPSSCPRVRETKIKKAYTDRYELQQLLETTWTHHDGRIMKVSDCFEENRLLIDLKAQPDEIKQLIFDTILESMENRGKFSMFHFIKFCAKHELKRVQDNVERYSAMLNC